MLFDGQEKPLNSMLLWYDRMPDVLLVDTLRDGPKKGGPRKKKPGVWGGKGRRGILFLETFKLPTYLPTYIT